MSRRIEIELTSRAGDGSWTWRAAGAKQPRGSVTAEMLPGQPSIGDVLRAVVESGIDGIEVVEVLPVKSDRADEQPGRIEVIGSPPRGPDVSVTLAPGSRLRRDGEERGARREGRRNGAPRAEGARRDGGDGARRERGARQGAGRRDDRSGASSRDDRAGPTRRDEPDRHGAGRRAAGGHPPEAEAGAPGARERRTAPPARRERRPATSTTHRNALLASLRPEQVPIAEQLLRGGIPAVRQAISEQEATAKAAGQPPVASDAILKMAEELLPAARLAEWKDRATTAQSAGRDLRLSELRAAVAASRTVTLDEEGRALAKSLREALDHRVAALRDDWVARIVKALEEGRVLDALRISAHAPEPGTRCPADVAVRLAETAGAAMSADRDPGEWLALLEGVLESPVRRTVKPAGLPADPELRAAARSASGLVPELAKLLGLRIPPPPQRRVPPPRPLSPAGGARPVASS
jgi:hypothetical protein